MWIRFISTGGREQMKAFLSQGQNSGGGAWVGLASLSYHCIRALSQHNPSVFYCQQLRYTPSRLYRELNGKRPLCRRTKGFHPGWQTFIQAQVKSQLFNVINEIVSKACAGTPKHRHSNRYHLTSFQCLHFCSVNFPKLQISTLTFSS